MNAFQRECIDATERLLSSRGVAFEVPFQEITGQHENYYKADIGAEDHLVEIYVYVDECGYMVDANEWRIFERPDFATEQELIGGFTDALAAVLDQFQNRGPKIL